MFSTFLEALRKAGIQVGPAEQLVLLDALQQDAIPPSPEAFYYLARATFVKDESLIDRFDKVFAQVFRGVLDSGGTDPLALPEAWLRALAEHHFSAEERARIEALGSLDAIMAALRQRLAEQHARHEGGNKWIGTGGTSPFGNAGYNPEGVRIGGQPRHGRAVKVWERRDFADFGSDRDIGTRNIKLALRRLRRFARQGARSELDLDATINGTAREGYLDIHLRPERHNAIKVLLFLDVGGSMDAHVRMVEQLFSAAVAEFRHLEFYYFHNCLYEGVWRDNARRHEERIPTAQVLNTYGHDYKAIFVGDASMSPYEVSHPGGSVEHYNAEAGADWLARARARWPASVWLNPTPQARWEWSASTKMIQYIFDGAMFALTLDGLDAAMRALMRPRSPALPPGSQ